MSKGYTFSLKVMIDKETNKLLFARADRHFVDIVLSFMTLPLGRIIKVLKQHYGDEVPTFGSLNNLYHSLSNLDSTHFVTDGAKRYLLNPISSLEDDYRRLKLDITDYQPAEYFECSGSICFYGFRSISMYYDGIRRCRYFSYHTMTSKVAKKVSNAGSSDGVWTIPRESFTIFDDLQLFPNEIGLVRILALLGITGANKMELIQVDLGFNEIMKLLRASLMSPTPLSDVILIKTTPMDSTSIPLNEISKEENPNSSSVSLKVVMQKSSGKLLYAQAKEDFVEFLFSLFTIPIGGAEHLMGGKTCFKAIDNLYRSTAEFLGEEYFKTADTKKRLMNPNLPHGCTSRNQILPLVEECLPADYTDDLSNFYSKKFPKGQGCYLEGPTTYHVTNDLIVTPFCPLSVLSSLNSLKILISDVEEREIQIGFKEGLSILKASLTSTSVLTDALLTPI
ncbi:uncharacterized protein LOC125188098 [Salvia hispanica]|uniref:uncharacterized protein LOC125188098 n=1 Tax=Salvia hispanica TaxID=49212 RepID=UPI002009B520|nr:uncharacterized protein LOC125188098 [Salvia hispanica]